MLFIILCATNFLYCVTPSSLADKIDFTAPLNSVIIKSLVSSVCSSFMHSKNGLPNSCSYETVSISLHCKCCLMMWHMVFVHDDKYCSSTVISHWFDQTQLLWVISGPASIHLQSTEGSSANPTILPSPLIHKFDCSWDWSSAIQENPCVDCYTAKLPFWNSWSTAGWMVLSATIYII